jgi:acyl transferase domain-containing protein
VEEALPWVLAGRDPGDLRARARALRDRVAAASPRGLAELASAAATEAAPLPERAVAFAPDREGALRELEALAASPASAGAIRGRARAGARVAFVFSPLRSEYRGAAVGLLERYPPFAARMATCEQELEPLLGWSLGDVLREREGAPPFARLDVIQPLLFAIGCSLAELWGAFGVHPGAVLGHSVGEIAAAVTCGALTPADGARVATTWGRSTMRLEGTGSMASLPLSAAATEARLERWRGRLAISGLNAASWSAVSGETEAMSALLEELARAGVMGRSMGINVPGHSEGMAPIKPWFAEELATISPCPSKVPFCSATEGRIVDASRLVAGYWSANLCQPVRFEAAVRALCEAGFDTFLEIGPRPILTGAIEENLAGNEGTIAIGGWEQGEADQFHLQLAEAHVLGVDVDWRPLCREPRVRAPGRRPLVLADLPERRRDQLLLDLVRREVAAVLGHDSPRAIEVGKPFKELGFDSLAAMDLRNALSRATGLDLSATLAFDRPTPRAVAAKLREELEEEDGGAGPGTAHEPQPDPAAERALRDIDELDLAGLVERGLGDGAGIPRED